MVEGRHFVHFRLRHIHRLGQRRHVQRGQVAVAVLDLVQVLDQQIAAARLAAKQRANLLARLRLDAAALEAEFALLFEAALLLHTSIMGWRQGENS